MSIVQYSAHVLIWSKLFIFNILCISTHRGLDLPSCSRGRLRKLLFLQSATREGLGLGWRNWLEETWICKWSAANSKRHYNSAHRFIGLNFIVVVLWVTSGRATRICNTLRPRQNYRPLTDDIFKCIFLEWKYILMWLTFHWSLLPGVKSIFQHWFR